MGNNSSSSNRRTSLLVSAFQRSGILIPFNRNISNNKSLMKKLKCHDIHFISTTLNNNYNIRRLNNKSRTKLSSKASSSSAIEEEIDIKKSIKEAQEIINRNIQ